ncbi:MAG: LuxR C-terminal-related transcriptional regulator, partial [Chloroflexota bacterium]
AGAWAQRYTTETSLMARRQRDFWHETLIFLQIQLATEKFSDALETMQSLLADLQENGRIGHHRELSALQAIALAQTDQRDDALHLLANTIESAQPEHDIMPFLQAGRALQPLLVDLRPKYASNRAIDTFIGDILSAFKTSVTPYVKPMIGIDIESLTERETEILHLIDLGLTNKAIAERLVISVATVKKHISNIFLKLDAKSRTQALNRAREYNLIQ